MPEALHAPVIEAASDTFEQLAYCFAEPGVVEPLPTSAIDGVVGVSFDGAARGGVVLQLSGGILPVLASNMLGLDEPPSQTDQRDALGEAANVICGNVLPRVAGVAAVFALGVPRHYPSWDDALADVGAPQAHVCLDVEGGRADVALVLQPAR